MLMWDSESVRDGSERIVWVCLRVGLLVCGDAAGVFLARADDALERNLGSKTSTRHVKSPDGFSSVQFCTYG